MADSLKTVTVRLRAEGDLSAAKSFGQQLQAEIQRTQSAIERDQNKLAKQYAINPASEETQNLAERLRANQKVKDNLYKMESVATQQHAAVQNEITEKAAKVQAGREEKAEISAMRWRTRQYDQEVRQRSKKTSDIKRIEDENYAATHTRQEAKIRELRQEYVEQAKLYGDDTATRAKLRETYKAKRDEAMREPQAGSGRGRAGIVGKLIAGYAAGTAVSDLTGNQQAGQLVGSTAGLLMLGQPEVAAAVAGLELVGSQMKEHRERLLFAAKAAREYTGELLRAGMAWGETSKKSIPTTPFGSSMEAIRDKARADVMEKQAGAEDIAVQMKSSSVGTIFDVISGKYNTDVMKLNLIGKSVEMSKFIEGQAESTRKREYQLNVQSREKVMTAENVESSVAGMAPGSKKEWTQLIAHQNTERVKRHEDFAAEKRAIDDTVKMDEAIYNEAEKKAREKAKITGAPDYRADPQFIQAGKQFQDDKERQRQLPEEQKKKDLDAQRQNTQEWKDENAKLDEEVLRAKSTAREANIKATTVGYARELALQKEKDAEELRRAKLQIPEIEKQTKKKIDAEVKARQVDAAIRVQEQAAPYDAASGAAVLQRKIDDAKAMGATPEQLHAIEVGSFEIEQRKAEIQVQSAERVLTLRQAAIAAALAAHPEATGNAQQTGAITAAENAKQDAMDQEEIAQRRISTEQSTLDILYAQHKISTEEYELKRAMVADRRAQESPADAAALQAAQAKAEEAIVAKDVEGYRVRGAQVELEIQVKRHGMTLREYDVQKMILVNRRAQDEATKGIYGPELKAIDALADKMQKQRGMEMMPGGQGTSEYQRGFVNTRNIDLRRPYDFHLGGTEMNAATSAAGYARGFARPETVGGPRPFTSSNMQTPVRSRWEPGAARGEHAPAMPLAAKADDQPTTLKNIAVTLERMLAVWTGS